jgi:hypothetical protein
MKQTSETSDNKNHEGKFSQFNNKVLVSQELECVNEEKGGNKDKTVILEQTQDTTDKTLLESVDKTI